MKFLFIAIVIFFIMILVGIIILTIGEFRCSYSIKSTGELFLKYGIIGFIAMSLFLGYFMVYKKFNKNTEMKIIEIVQEDVENGYKLYIDGQEIDINTINLDKYEITIKDDEKIVILDRKWNYKSLFYLIKGGRNYDG